MQGGHTGELLAVVSKIQPQAQSASAPVYGHADCHPSLHTVLFDGAEEGKVGVGYGGVGGVARATVLFGRFGKVGVGGVYAGDDADGVRDVALHLQLRGQILGRGHRFDARVRVIPAQCLHTVFVKLCAAFKDLHVADFHGVRSQLLRIPVRGLICTSACRVLVKYTCGAPVACVKVLDVNGTLILIDHATEHAHALINVVAQHVVRYRRQHRGLDVNLELVLGLRLLQSEGG
jgi:hypothetical protein